MGPEIAVPLIIAASIVSISVMGILKDYSLKKEQIKANALVKAEEIKARNQLEIEKLIHGGNARANSPRVNNSLSYSDDEQKVREKNGN